MDFRGTTLFIFIILLSTTVSKAQLSNAVLEDFDGDMYTLESVLEEKRYVVNLYADWCGWCKVEWDHWSACIDDVKDGFQVEFLAICTNKDVPDNDSKETLRTSLGEHIDLEKISLHYINQDTLKINHGIIAYPTTFIVDEMGNFLDTLKGLHKCDELEEILIQHFGQSSLNEDLFDKLNPSIFYHEKLLTVELEFAGTYSLVFYNVLGQKISTKSDLMGKNEMYLDEFNDEIVIVSVIVNDRVIASEKILVIP